MKVKNIVFSGFAAAVLMGVAADASATTEIATKAYVDRLDLTEVGAAGSYIQKVRQADGQVGAETIQFDTVINEEDTEHTNAPTSKAVRDYVTEANNLGTLNLDPVGTDGSYIKIVEQADGLVGATATQFDQTISASSSHENAPTSKAVYDAVQSASNVNLDLDEVGAVGSYIQKVAQADGQVSATETAFDQTISASSTNNNAPTSLAVYNAIQAAVPNADACDSDLCVWTSQGWVNATEPLVDPAN